MTLNIVLVGVGGMLGSILRFLAQGYVLWATYDARGKIEKFHVGGSRMRDMPFDRLKK